MLKKFIVALIFVFAGLPNTVLAIPGFIKARMGTASGQVMYDGKPLPGVIVSFFDVKKGLPPIAVHKGRIPERIVLADKDGRFSLKYLQGEYYLGAMQRSDKSVVGPPRAGEKFYFARQDSGNLLKVAIRDYKKKEYGAITFALPDSFTVTEDSFRVEGTVLKGAKGEEPFAGALVLAKTSKSQFKRPEYVSVKTGADGKFSLNLRPGQTFYLNARTTLTGKRPKPGDIIGRYSADVGKNANVGNPSGAGPPPGVGEDQPFKVLNDEELPVSGVSGEVVSGIKIYMYAMPETGPAAQKPIQQQKRRAAGISKFSEGAVMKVFFASNSHSVKSESFAELDEWVRFLKGDPGLLIELDGYADNVGDAKYNLHLSRQRAQAVADYFTGKGIDVRRIRVLGYGSIISAADVPSEGRKQRNRRVEIKFIR